MKRVLFPVVVAALVAGCGDGPEIRRTYPVTGTLTIDGAPADVGVVITLIPQFVETDKHPIHPRALMAQGGTFKFTTYNNDDGVPEGEYVATVEWPPRPLMSSFASGDMFGGAFANPDKMAAMPGFKFTVTKNGATLDLKLTLTPAQKRAVEVGKKKVAEQNAGGFNLTDR